MIKSPNLRFFLALVIGLVGLPASSALAQGAGQQDESRLDLRPDRDTAAVGTCNAFRVVAHDAQGNRANAEVFIQLFQHDQDNLQDLLVGFCNPAVQRGTAGEAEGPADCDDNLPRDDAGSVPPFVCTHSEGTETSAMAERMFDTRPDNPNTPQNEAGTVVFGVFSNEPGEMLVRAGAELEGVGFVDESANTWVAGGPAAVSILDCAPEDEITNEDTLHQFVCTATDADGVAISNVDVEAEITTGPNAGHEVTCGQPDPHSPGGNQVPGPAPTDNEGRVTCQYGDHPNSEDVGTDTIVAFVDQDDDGLVDSGEPRDKITKTWRNDDVTRGPCAGRQFNTSTPIVGGTGNMVVGSPGDDALVGTEGDDIICALGGDDQVSALAGDDLVFGGRGDDLMEGGKGEDELRGGGGHDVLRGGKGNDSLSGGRGNDILRGGPDSDGCSGGAGRDGTFGCEGQRRTSASKANQFKSA